MKKILLFSSNGYVGGFLQERLKNEKDIQLYEMKRGWDHGQYQTHYDILIYSAAVTSARQETSEKYVQDNVVTAVSIVEFCKKHFVKRIIYLSSDEIYGELNTEKVTDKAIMVNPNLYAATKYLAEKIIINSGIPYYILRLPGIVGRIWGRSFLYRIMDKVKCNEQVDLYNLDRKFNNILDIDDLTRFILLLCMEHRKNNAILLLGNTEYILLRELVFYIKDLYHSNSVINNIDGDSRRYFTLDVTTAIEYGYRSKQVKTIINDLYKLRKNEV